MTDVRFFPASREHAEELAPDMREADVREVASCGQTPLQALLDSLEASDIAFTAKFNGRVAFMFGVGPAVRHGTLLGTTDVGWAWLLTGNLVRRYPQAFLRHRHWCLRILLKQYPTLLGFVDGEYRGALWLVKKLGFTVGKETPVSGRPFVTVSIRRDAWAQ